MISILDPQLNILIHYTVKFTSTANMVFNISTFPNVQHQDHMYRYCYTWCRKCDYYIIVQLKFHADIKVNRIDLTMRAGQSPSPDCKRRAPFNLQFLHISDSADVILYSSSPF